MTSRIPRRSSRPTVPSGSPVRRVCRSRPHRGVGGGLGGLVQRRASAQRHPLRHAGAAAHRCGRGRCWPSGTASTPPRRRGTPPTGAARRGTGLRSRRSTSTRRTGRSGNSGRVSRLDNYLDTHRRSPEVPSSSSRWSRFRCRQDRVPFLRHWRTGYWKPKGRRRASWGAPCNCDCPPRVRREPFRDPSRPDSRSP